VELPTGGKVWRLEGCMGQARERFEIARLELIPFGDLFRFGSLKGQQSR
tara:strand:+ start:1315 stop:1461 length:147 start_codon:yes stop_codon:yes gene_type:complete